MNEQEIAGERERFFHLLFQGAEFVEMATDFVPVALDFLKKWGYVETSISVCGEHRTKISFKRQPQGGEER